MRTPPPLLETTTSSPPPAEPRDSDDDGEEEESLSLCNFPVMTRNGALHTDSHQSDLFEFVGGVGSEMCAADDIFLRGQLLPYMPPPTTPVPLSSRTRHGHESKKFPSDHERFPRRHTRSESLDEFERSRGGGGAATRCWKGRGCLSAGYQKLRRAAETTACDSRTGKRVGRCDVSEAARPKWYVFVFGSVRMPGEMDMREIRSRQRRRNPSALGLGHEGRRTDSVTGVGEGKTDAGGPWRLLRSLSCKGDVDGVVAAPLRFGLT